MILPITAAGLAPQRDWPRPDTRALPGQLLAGKFVMLGSQIACGVRVEIGKGRFTIQRFGRNSSARVGAIKEAMSPFLKIMSRPHSNCVSVGLSALHKHQGCVMHIGALPIVRGQNYLGV